MPTSPPPAASERDGRIVVGISGESTAGSMDTSSDGGSTVRELNRQLKSTDDEDNDGNDGMASDSGNAHHGVDDSE